MPFGKRDCKFCSLCLNNLRKTFRMDGVRSREENLPFGTFAGAIAAVLGAVIWMGITLPPGCMSAIVALGVGALVGLAIRYAGNGIEHDFRHYRRRFDFDRLPGRRNFAMVQLVDHPATRFLQHADDRRFDPDGRHHFR